MNRTEPISDELRGPDGLEAHIFWTESSILAQDERCGKEIYCQTGGAPWAGIQHSIFCSQMNRSLSRITEVKTEAAASDIGNDQLVYRC